MVIVGYLRICACLIKKPHYSKSRPFHYNLSVSEFAPFAFIQ